MLGEGLRRLAQGERPHLSDLLLTPSTALKVTEQLPRPPIMAKGASYI